MTVTPEQIKTAARELRALEQDRLGDSLAHTSVLNTLTRALGLGASFSAYTNARKDDARPDAPIPVEATIFVANPHEDTHTLPDIGLDDRLIADLSEHHAVEFHPAAHGFEMLTVSRTARKGAPQALRQEITEVVAPLVRDIGKAGEEGLVPAPVRHYVSATRDRLFVNFRYHDNDQVCTAKVPRAAWMGRAVLGLRDEAVLLVMAEEIEIAPHVDPGDITVEDVFETMVFHTES